MVSRNLDLAGYVSSGLSGGLTNGMPRMLAGVEDFHHADVNDQTLTHAKSNIETLFDAVILSESFDLGLLILAESLRWKTPYYLRRKVGNYGSSSGNPDERTRTVIENHNRLDCELQAWATNRFAAKSSTDSRLASKVQRFQKENASHGKAVFCLREAKRRLRL